MKIIIPMSGKGKRFVDSGYNIRKPLLRVDGKTIIEHVIDIFPGENDFIFICSEDDIKNTEMKKILITAKPTAKIISIPAHKKGPVFAISQIFNHISDNEPVFISYCDYGQRWNYDQFKKEISHLKPDGAIPSYTGFHPHLLRKNLYAGILANREGIMTDIKEKHCFTRNPEDSFHSGGSYYFKTGALVKKYFQKLIDKNINLNEEFYVSMVYYLLKEDGLKIFIPTIEQFMQWGTPEDLEEYEAWSRYFHSKFNKNKEITEIPADREKFIRIPYEEGSQEFEKSYQYWKNHFIKIWST